jgi:hypothetical protein
MLMNRFGNKPNQNTTKFFDSQEKEGLALGIRAKMKFFFFCMTVGIFPRIGVIAFSSSPEKPIFIE